VEQPDEHQDAAVASFAFEGVYSSGCVRPLPDLHTALRAGRTP